MGRLTKFYPLILILCGSICYGQEAGKKLQLSLSAGRTQEDFRWDIAGNINGQSPNVLSELTWKNVSGAAYNAELRWNFWNRFSAIGSYNRVKVNSGDINDTDYSGDNRTQPVYQQNFSDNKGFTSSWYAGAGFLIINNRRFSLTPYIGYSRHTQSLYIVDLTGQFPDLNSSYKANWNGVFLKAASSLKVLRKLNLAADVTYNQVDYGGEGNWNLISQFQHPLSYRHDAKGYGIAADARLIYNIAAHVGITVGYGYYHWETGNGTDQLYLSSGQVDKTQLNGVVRSGYAFNGGVVLSL